MQRRRDNTERLRELAARIAAEHDHDKFTALVKEFNELLDGTQVLSRAAERTVTEEHEDPDLSEGTGLVAGFRVADDIHVLSSTMYRRSSEK